MTTTAEAGTVEVAEDDPGDLGPARDDKPDGPVAAAILASGIGCLSLGLLTTAAMASGKLQSWLEWKVAVGPLSGKTSTAVIVWLVSWALLHRRLRNEPTWEIRRAFVIALVLIGLGVLGTFPPFFQSFRPN